MLGALGLPEQLPCPENPPDCIYHKYNQEN
jgi:hypothetical protein